ncbi:MAG: nagB 3 [Phycisphaerales bacterium]|nr:nagB 3 [Phycisphaerales bacterium]
MPTPITLLSTIKGSLLERFYPAGWDLARMDACAAMARDELLAPANFWHAGFAPVVVDDVAAMDERMGDAIADEIEAARRNNLPLALILPVGPMGMYKRVVARLTASRTPCDHVTTFNMDEWSDAAGTSMPGNQPGGFEHAMTHAMFGPLGDLAVPPGQRNFATRDNLPTYAGKIAGLKARGGRLVTVYGVGRVCHIAFWEPHLAAEFPVLADWKRQTHKVGVALQPLTVEQNAITSFASRFTLVPCFANTIGPGLFLQSDACIGGADGAYPAHGAQWQGMSIAATLKYGPDPWVPSTFMPTLPGRLFVVKELVGPLVPAAH